MKLTQELVKERFDYRADGKLIWKIRVSNRINIGDVVGCISKHENDSRIIIGINGIRYGANRIIFLWHHGWLPKIVDHINHNSLDDRIENLREATQKENIRHRKGANKNSQSQYLGVSFKKQFKKYDANIFINGKQTYLGRFETKEEAALIYNKASVKHFGEFAHINIIKPQ